MASLRHPNVVLFLGVCFKPPAMLTEFCARGSMLDILRKGLTNEASHQLPRCTVTSLHLHEWLHSCDSSPVQHGLVAIMQGPCTSLPRCHAMLLLRAGHQGRAGLAQAAEHGPGRGQGDAVLALPQPHGAAQGPEVRQPAGGQALARQGGRLQPVPGGQGLCYHLPGRGRQPKVCVRSCLPLRPLPSSPAHVCMLLLEGAQLPRRLTCMHDPCVLHAAGHGFMGLKGCQQLQVAAARGSHGAPL